MQTTHRLTSPAMGAPNSRASAVFLGFLTYLRATGPAIGMTVLMNPNSTLCGTGMFTHIRHAPTKYARSIPDMTIPLTPLLSCLLPRPRNSSTDRIQSVVHRTELHCLIPKRREQKGKSRLCVH